MNVTVVGSYDEGLARRNDDGDNAQTRRALFQEACREIGRFLCANSHRLFVAHWEQKETAEALALSEYHKAKSKNYEQMPHHRGQSALKPHLDSVEKSDVVILIGGENGTYASGLGALRQRKVIVPIPWFGGSARDLLEIPEIGGSALSDDIRNMDFNSQTWKSDLDYALNRILGEYPRTLIIHGRGDNGFDLRERITNAGNYPIRDKSELRYPPFKGLAEPVIMDLAGQAAVSVPEVFEKLASEVAAAIVIVTADDLGGFARVENSGEPKPAVELTLSVRARENVWVEVGWFWGRLGRERVLLWIREQMELPSDLQGVAKTFGKDLDLAWPSIVKFLDAVRRGAATGGTAPEAPPRAPVQSSPLAVVTTDPEQESAGSL